MRLRVYAVVTLLLAPLFAMAFSAKPAQAADGDVEHVVVVGAVGLRWDDVDPEATPTLWDLTRRGSAGSLSIRAARGGLTCPADGWVTLGAGNRASAPTDRSRSSCPTDFPIAPPVTKDGAWQLDDQQAIVEKNASYDFGALPGILASSVRCASAVGPQAAVAAARTSGRIDDYSPTTPRDLPAYLSRCPLTVIQAPSVVGSDLSLRQEAAANTDSYIATLFEALPAHSLLIVAGIADIATPANLHVVLAHGPKYRGGRLESASTRRSGYTQLIDIAPTVLSALGAGIPPSVAGQPMRAAGEQSDVVDEVAAMRDANTAAVRVFPLVQPFYSFLVYANLAFLLLATIFFRRRRLFVGETLPDPAAGHAGTPHLLRNSTERRQASWISRIALFLAAIPAASYAANLFPWWRSSSPGWLLAGIVGVVALIVTASALAGPWRHHVLGAPGFVAGVTAVLLAGDVISGSHLQIDALAGYSSLVAGRFIGFGNYAFALFAACSLLATAYISHALPLGWQRGAWVAVAGCIAIAIVGFPAWGSDVGGIIAITPAFVILGIRVTGLWLSPLRLLGSFVIGLIVVGAFAWFDYLRPADEQTHLGRFVGQIFDGGASTILHRKAEANINLLVSSQLTVLVAAVVIFVPLVLMPRSAGLRRVFGLYPVVRAGVIAVMMAAAIGFAVNDSGIAIPAFAIMVTLPLLVSTILRALESGTSQNVGQ